VIYLEGRHVVRQVHGRGQIAKRVIAVVGVQGSVPALLHEQAPVCLSNRETVDASRGRTFNCEMANNRVFLLWVWPNLFSHLAAFNP